jgi:hypothetical protein
MNTSEPTIDFNDLISKYVRIRDKKGQVAHVQKQELAKFDTALAAIERLLLTEFQRTGTNSVNTDHGTAFKKTQTSVTIADKDVFRNFIRSSEDNWIFADIRANAPAVKAYLDENEALPPGVNLVSRLTVNIQR